MNFTWERGYFVTVGAEIVLGVLAVTAGGALRKGAGWGWRVAFLYWGTALALFGAISIWLLPSILIEFFRNPNLLLRAEPELYGRFVVYGLTMTGAPYALWTMMRAPESGRPSRRVSWSWSLSGVAAGTVIFFSLVYRP